MGIPYCTNCLDPRYFRGPIHLRRPLFVIAGAQILERDRRVEIAGEKTVKHSVGITSLCDD